RRGARAPDDHQRVLGSQGAVLVDFSKEACSGVDCSLFRPYSPQLTSTHERGFATIARTLGVSRQAVHRRFRSLLADEEVLQLSLDARRVLRLAREDGGARADRT